MLFILFYFSACERCFYQGHARIYTEGLGLGSGVRHHSHPAPRSQWEFSLENFSGSAHEGVYLFFRRPLLIACYWISTVNWQTKLIWQWHKWFGERYCMQKEVYSLSIETSAFLDSITCISAISAWATLTFNSANFLINLDNLIRTQGEIFMNDLL